MREMKFSVSNVMCGGCATNIREGLAKLPGVSQVSVEVSSGAVEVQGEALDTEVLADKLAELGYPLVNR